MKKLLIPILPMLCFFIAGTASANDSTEIKSTVSTAEDIKLPPGFKAVVVAERLGRARHLVVKLQNKRVLAPEYGGDGKKEGRCEGISKPLVAFPGHLAPNALLFYTGKSAIINDNPASC